MKYIQIDKARLINLEYSLFREMIRTNRAGAYSSTTIIGCNTRKYHGLLVCPIESLGNEPHVMLSAMNLSVIQNEKIFNLGIQQYQGNHFDPKGHKYALDFELDPTPKLTFRVGGVVISQELLLVEKENQVLLRYTLEDAHSPTRIRIKPFLAFRHIHQLTHENLLADTRYEPIPNGISVRLYEAFPKLNIQASKPVEYIHVPDWYRGVEYVKERYRGYDFSEDLYVPGYFECEIAKGESVVFSAALNAAAPGGLKAKYTRELKNRIPRYNMRNNLINAAQQFLHYHDKSVSLLAGYHWYGEQLRDSLIALPGLAAYQEQKTPYRKVLESCIDSIEKKYLLVPHALPDADVPLWLFYTLQQWKSIEPEANLEYKYYPLLKRIIHLYQSGASPIVQLQPNGLISAYQQGKALTWMKAYAFGEPVTPRYGSPIEVNALWYNALKWTAELAKTQLDQVLVEQLEPLIEQSGNAFIDAYWMENRQYLADCIFNGKQDKSVRANQIIATALPFSPLSKEQKKAVIDLTILQLVTPRGIRTLSPQDAKYQGVVEGDEDQRHQAFHQGAAYPWLSAFLATGYLNLHKQSGVATLKRLLEEFEPELNEHCLGTISECYNGNPPHQAKGAISMAWNVAAVLSIIKLTESYS